MGIMVFNNHINSRMFVDWFKMEFRFIHDAFQKDWSGVVGIAPHVDGGAISILDSLGLLPHPAKPITELSWMLLWRLSYERIRVPVCQSLATCLTGNKLCSFISQPARVRLSRATPSRHSKSCGAFGASMSTLVR